MKALLLPALLLTTTAALAQYQPPPPTEAEKRAAAKAAQESGAEQAQPFKGANTIKVRLVADSTATAYRKVAAALLAAGYTLDRADKELLFINTKPRLLDGGVSVKVQASVTPGSIVTMRGVFTRSSAITIYAHTDTREMPVEYLGPGTNPARRAWQAMQDAATALNGQLAYQRKP